MIVNLLPLSEGERVTTMMPLPENDEIESIFKLLEKREELRKNKQFEEADEIRREISDMGIQLIDHKTKTLWMKKEKINSDTS